MCHTATVVLTGGGTLSRPVRRTILAGLPLDNITTWGQLGAACMIGAGILIFSVAQLIKVMMGSYGQIVAALQKQNASQQEQINELRDRLNAADRECEKKIAALKLAVAAVAKKVNDSEERHP